MNARLNKRSAPVTEVVLAVLLCLGANAFAIKNETNQNRWEKPCQKGPDAVVPGFLVNMGPTGARGILAKNSFVVKYVFPESPADGRLQVDDEVTGANGKPFAEHTFSGKSDAGIVGPIQDMGLAIEDSEGSDGVLRLTVKRGEQTSEVNIQLEKLGRFADTFPVNCPKTEILKARAYRYLMDHPGGVSSPGRCVAALAMLSSEDPEVFAEGRRRVLEWNRIPGQDTWSWHLGFQAMTLAEYYLLTKDEAVLGTLEALMEQLRYAQWKGPEIRRWTAKEGEDQAVVDRHQALYEGGFGHAPYPVVVQRAGGPGNYGGGGYGPMQRPTYLAILGWQLGRQCGLKTTHPGLEQAFTFVDSGTRVSGNTGYGGEFTMNNGPVDPVKWKQGTQHGNSHRSGMAYLLYMLSPERPESAAMMKVHLKNIDAAYRDMPDGHACPMMGLVWGWAGVYASDDAALKRKITGYYKAWINMARCHGSDSYVILPGRNYADGSYYNDNIRNHTTGSMAFLYSFSTPKLRLQGASASVIPGTKGQNAEAGYAERLAALKGDILGALPLAGKGKTSAYLKACTDEQTATALLEAASHDLAKVDTARELVAHARDTWIAKADKGIAAAEADLKTATTEAGREAATQALARWRMNRQQGEAAPSSAASCCAPSASPPRRARSPDMPPWCTGHPTGGSSASAPAGVPAGQRRATGTTAISSR